MWRGKTSQMGILLAVEGDFNPFPVACFPLHIGPLHSFYLALEGSFTFPHGANGSFRGRIFKATAQPERAFPHYCEPDPGYVFIVAGKRIRGRRSSQVCSVPTKGRGVCVWNMCT